MCAHEENYFCGTRRGISEIIFLPHRRRRDCLHRENPQFALCHVRASRIGGGKPQKIDIKKEKPTERAIAAVATAINAFFW